MDKNISSSEEIIKDFDKFEKILKKDPSDPQLKKFFENFDELVLTKHFLPEELILIRERLEKLRVLFSKYKDEIREKGRDFMDKHNQSLKYLKK